jgi:hypothetical protein
MRTVQGRRTIGRRPPLHTLFRQGHGLNGHQYRTRIMNDAGEKIRLSLVKHEKAIEKFREKKREFMTARDQITREIESARVTWQATLEQIHNLPFS